MARKAFSIHSDFYNELRSLSPAARGDMLLALIDWATDKDPPPLEPESAMLFRLMCAQIKRISAVNASNGAQGGRPNGKSEESGKSEANRKKPTVSVTVTDPVTVSDTVSTDNCAEPSADAGAPRRTPLLSLPLNDKSEYPVFEEQAHEWAALYPAVDVIQQLRNMRGWLDANPTKRKTKAGILNFVNRWLAKEQDRGSNVAGARGGQASSVVKDYDEPF